MVYYDSGQHTQAFTEVNARCCTVITTANNTALQRKITRKGTFGEAVCTAPCTQLKTFGGARTPLL